MKNIGAGVQYLTCTRFFTTHIFSPAINRGVI